MCGIAGFIGEGVRIDIERMTDALQHRGPDADGFYQDQSNGVFLGHRRLSIIDIQDGKQPMSTTDDKLVITFNGEIYNHMELRHALEQKGHWFVKKALMNPGIHPWQRLLSTQTITMKIIPGKIQKPAVNHCFKAG